MRVAKSTSLAAMYGFSEMEKAGVAAMIKSAAKANLRILGSSCFLNSIKRLQIAASRCEVARLPHPASIRWDDSIRSEFLATLAARETRDHSCCPRRHLVAVPE